MEAVVFVFSLLDCCALIFLSVYFIITLSDLECDYINARSCCSKLNKWVIPELIGHTIVTVLMLVSLHWFIFLLNLPVATWNIYRCLYFMLLGMQTYEVDKEAKHRITKYSRSARGGLQGLMSGGEPWLGGSRMAVLGPLRRAGVSGAVQGG
uniref:protein cornichon homolog 4 isoform X1 n=1 Tax=Halichoerus grypus TaxID=9711 RepID=UPI0016593052|nr:protein cornichon homolog 4 isoform X1 [Halichoerus grypus]